MTIISTATLLATLTWYTQSLYLLGCKLHEEKHYVLLISGVPKTESKHGTYA